MKNKNKIKALLLIISTVLLFINTSIKTYADVVIDYDQQARLYAMGLNTNTNMIISYILYIIIIVILLILLIIFIIIRENRKKALNINKSIETEDNNNEE